MHVVHSLFGENGQVPRSRFTIDVGAVRRNAARLVDVLGGSELWAVVKADGYGHGALDVSRAALAGGARALCVATVAEGAKLRAALPEPRIVVLGPTADRELATAREARLELVVGTAGPVPGRRAAPPQARHGHGPLGPLRARRAAAASTSSA